MSLKKYLYVFRPLLACRWIERQLGQVPMLFAQLVEGGLDETDVRAALAELVARKQAGEELAVAPPVEALTRFIEAELPRLEALNEPDDAAGEVGDLNGFFRRYALAARGGKNRHAGVCNSAAPAGCFLEQSRSVRKTPARSRERRGSRGRSPHRSRLADRK